MVAQKSKICLDCQKDLPTEAFHRKGIYWDSRCKPCVLKRKKASYKAKNTNKLKQFKNIIIMPHHAEIDIKGHDMASLLEFFLLEECISEQRISA